MIPAQGEPIGDVLGFLKCRTPAPWFEQALERIPTLLVDHANCEKKAAGTALSLMYRYVDKPLLLQRLSRLAREELRHFEQVHRVMQSSGVEYVHLTSSRYAAGLHKLVSHVEPQRLVDSLLIGAIVEARSCERFLGLVEILPAELSDFYAKLLSSEARHFRSYLKLARDCAADAAMDGLSLRLEAMLQVEAELTSAPDSTFRFHSGPLAQSTPAAS